MKRDQADFCLQLLRAIFSSKKEKTAERGQWESNWYSLVLFAALFCRNLLTTKTVYLAPNGRFSLEDDVSHEPYFSVLKKSQNCWSNRVEKTKLDYIHMSWHLVLSDLDQKYKNQLAISWIINSGKYGHSQREDLINLTENLGMGLTPSPFWQWQNIGLSWYWTLLFSIFGQHHWTTLISSWISSLISVLMISQK